MEPLRYNLYFKVRSVDETPSTICVPIDAYGVPEAIRLVQEKYPRLASARLSLIRTERKKRNAEENPERAAGLVNYR